LPAVLVTPSSTSFQLLDSNLSDYWSSLSTILKKAHKLRISKGGGETH
jgi:hypothetical protein